MPDAVIARVSVVSPVREELLERASRLVPRPARLDSLCLAGLALADQLLDGAGMPERHALVLGTALGCLESDYEFYGQVLEKGLSRSNPRVFAYTLPNVVLGEIAIAFGLFGEQVVLTAGRASGLVALGEAGRLVAGGDVDAALVFAIDVEGPGTRRIFRALGTEPEPIAAGFLVHRGAGLARMTAYGCSFDPRSTAEDPSPDPLGGGGIRALAGALARGEACSVSVRCTSGHVAMLEVCP